MPAWPPGFPALAAWGIMVNVWSVLLYLQGRLRRDGTLLTATPPDDDATRAAGAVSVAVVIPARNEEDGIADCLRSVLAQDHPQLAVHVVDDRSEDRTADRVRAVAAADARVHFSQITHLPAGWLGKSHALSHATADLDADWLLFLDADARLLAPAAVRAAVAEAARRDAALFTLLPAQATGGFGEAMLIPLCSAVMALWYGTSNTRKSARAAFANGQFLLIRRDVYEAVGGHTAVRRAIIEDVPLAEAVRRAGHRTRAGGGAALVSVRMYQSAAATFTGWSRIFVGALRSPIKLILSILWLVFGSLLPFVAAPWLAYGWLTAGSDAAPELFPLTALCVSHLVLLILVSRGFWALGGCDRRHLWLYPVSVLGVIAILSHALWTLTVTRRLGWRSTAYRFDRRGRILDPVASPAPDPAADPASDPA